MTCVDDTACAKEHRVEAHRPGRLRLLVLACAALLTTLALTYGLASSALASTSQGTTAHYSGSLADGTTWAGDIPSNWNGTLLLYSHGFGTNDAASDTPPSLAFEADLLGAGYGFVGSSYDPSGPEWALNNAVQDQFDALAAFETALPSAPTTVLAIGISEGGLISALEDQDSTGQLSGALTMCGVVAGAVDTLDYQLEGSYVLDSLLGAGAQLDGYQSDAQATAAGDELRAIGAAAQQTPEGRARLALAAAFYNVATWPTVTAGSVELDPFVRDRAEAPDASEYVSQEQDQYDTEFAPTSFVLPFEQGVRYSMEQSSGGQPSSDAGIDFAAALAASPYYPEVAALYGIAGISLNTDLQILTHGAAVSADPNAERTLETTSVPNGTLAVPELDVHTTADELVPVQQENAYQQSVSAAGYSGLLDQAYVDSEGHCNFTPGETIASVHALEARISTGTWSAATPAALNAVAGSLNEGASTFIQYAPGALTGGDPLAFGSDS